MTRLEMRGHILVTPEEQFNLTNQAVMRSINLISKSTFIKDGLLLISTTHTHTLVDHHIKEVFPSLDIFITLLFIVIFKQCAIPGPGLIETQL